MSEAPSLPRLELGSEDGRVVVAIRRLCRLTRKPETIAITIDLAAAAALRDGLDTLLATLAPDTDDAPPTVS